MTKTPSPEARPNNKRRPTRFRTKYTREQLSEMEKVFGVIQYPDTLTMLQLSRSLDVCSEKISVWFQNRRSKFKRQTRRGHVTWMRRQLYTGGHDNDMTPRSSSCHVLSPPEVTPFIPSETPTPHLYHNTEYPGDCYNSPTVTPYSYYDYQTSPPEANNRIEHTSSDWLMFSHVMNDITAEQTDDLTANRSSCAFASPAYFPTQTNTNFYVSNNNYYVYPLQNTKTIDDSSVGTV